MAKDSIVLRGLRENNLKNISLDIPKRKITVFTGVSGSGKSSIVFDTIAEEAGRQLNETFSNMVRLFLPRHRQPDAEAIENLATAIVIDQRRIGGNARSTVGTITDINGLIRLLFSRFGTPHLGYGNAYSFNDPAGMCPCCEGIGKTRTLDIGKALDMDKSLAEGAILLPGYAVGSYYWKVYAQSGFFDTKKPIRDYTPDELAKLLYAGPEKITIQHNMEALQANYMGFAERFFRLGTSEREKSEESKKRFEQFTETATCPHCGGKRYNALALSSTVNGYTIFDLTDMQVDALIPVLRGFDDPKMQPIVASIIERLSNMAAIGLDYITLTRETATLSGGESQRIKMVKHLSSSLTDVLYIFDEPSIGLHPRDVHRLNELLCRLRDKGNTVLVVEHDPDVMRIADHVVDMGPRAGAHGGQVVYEGSYEGLLTAGTLTSEYLNRPMSVNENPRPARTFLESRDSTLHNLKNVRLRVPEGIFTVVTGVAGSGKSTLVSEVFAKDHPEAIHIDQDAVNVNVRSNPATYTGIMDTIRKCFAAENNVQPGLFSYNSEGACPNCKGLGTVEINLSFMDKMVTPCEVCGGKRYSPDVLTHQYKGKHIVDVMDMTIDDSALFFDTGDVRRKLRDMQAVGLGYMTLGQPLTTLSGGECQRLKLAKELGRKGNIYILDEPTTGLHMSDIGTILGIIDTLVARGNTVIAIEHNLDVIRRADWIIDMGPDGGNRGGEILYEGTPAGLLGCEGSVTAKYLGGNR